MLQVRRSSKLCFRLLGQATVALESDAVRVSGQKGLALLIYLAVHAGQSISRGVLADLLWSDRGDAAARQNLRQTILTLRRDLGPEHADLLQVDDRSLALAPQQIEVDAGRFAEFATSKDPAGRLRCLDFGWGSFLDGFVVGAEGFDDWVVAERHRLDALAIRTFAALAVELDAAKDGERAIAAMERLVAIDPGDEERHRRLLAFEARYRGPDAALACAKSLAALLRRELDAEPEAATRALIEDIERAARTQPLCGEGPARPPAAPIIAAAAPSTIPAIVARPDAPAGSRSMRRWALAAAVLIVTAGTGAMALRHFLVGDLKASRAPDAAVSHEPSANVSWRSPPFGAQAETAAHAAALIPIVVLPFTADAEGSLPLADEITDDLINFLSRINRLRVISRNTSALYKGKPVDPAALAAELGVRYAVEGSVRWVGDHPRVNVELTDTASRLTVWSDQIPVEPGDRHAAENDIVIRISRALQVETLALEVARAGPKPSQAYQIIDKGWITLARGSGKRDLLKKAKTLFEQALARDPDSLEARVGIAAYDVDIVSEVLTGDPKSHTDEALKLLRAVIAQDPRSARAHYYLGRARRNADDFEGALMSFERAIELNQSYTLAHAQAGLTLMFLRQPAAALEHIRYAIRLSPRDSSLPYWLRFAAEAELDLGRDRDALSDVGRSLEMAPQQLRAWALLAAAQTLSGNTAAADRAVANVRRIGAQYSDDQLLAQLGRLARLGPNRLHDGLQRALARSSRTASH
jgi:DNA-binding SARP family transcriptional activator/TolB-like protein